MSIRIRSILLIILAFTLGNCPSLLEAQKTERFAVTSYKLKNGLGVILAQDESLPIVSVVVGYRAGAVSEQTGKTGLAYLLENLMFQGSENVGRMRHVSFIQRIGGELNADTRIDKSLYYQRVPSNQLALVLWLESDRMRSLEITPANVEKAKEALGVELRQRRANEPFFESSFSFDQILFPDFSYSHPMIGNEEDIKNISLDDVAEFYSNYYAPNNAVLCLAGSFNKVKAKELIAKYFETIPARKEIPPFVPSRFDEKKEIAETLQDPMAPSPAFHLGFRIFSPRPPDLFALRVLDYLLLRGKSSRLYVRLLRKEHLVFQLSGGIDERKNLEAYKIFATVNNELMTERCLQAIFSEFDKLRSSFVSDEELAKAKNMLKMDTLGRTMTSEDRALFFAEAYLNQRDLDNVFADLETSLKVTPSDIVNLMNRYFTKENSILLKIKPR